MKIYNTTTKQDVYFSDINQIEEVLGMAHVATVSAEEKAHTACYFKMSGDDLAWWQELLQGCNTASEVQQRLIEEGCF